MLQPSLVLKEGKVWYILIAFWGKQDAAYRVVGMTTHRFGMATHQPLSHTWLYTAIGRYCMIITCKPHGVNLIGATIQK